MNEAIQETKNEEEDRKGTPKKTTPSKSHRSPLNASDTKYEQRSRFQTVVSSPAFFLKEKNNPQAKSITNLVNKY